MKNLTETEKRYKYKQIDKIKRPNKSYQVKISIKSSYLKLSLLLVCNRIELYKTNVS